jgi:hypothetical protein
LSVKLRYFAGFSNIEAAEVLGVSPRTADRHWNYAPRRFGDGSRLIVLYDAWGGKIRPTSGGRG